MQSMTDYEVAYMTGYNACMDDMKSMHGALSRASTLLNAAHDLLKKQELSPYVLNMLAETVYYDEAECDGSCLIDDIEYWFDEFGLQ